MDIKLNASAKFIISRLESHGFTAYAVGGCVRDMLIGREVNDFDITTSALPSEIKSAFPDYKVIETGIKHGTVTVIVENSPFEITTFRAESDYGDSRRPDSVRFIKDVCEDLRRRDFKMNAIAFSPKDGIVDPYGGITDINNSTISTVGNPIDRFSEDALRILRALRFSSVLGFNVQAETSNAIFQLYKTMEKVSKERIYEELKKLICGKNAYYVLENYKNVINFLLPINNLSKDIDLLPQNPAFRFAFLCGNDTEKALETLKSDNATRNLATLLAKSSPIPNNEIALKHYISSLGKPHALSVAEYRRCLFKEDINCNVERLCNSNQCLFINQLAINGNDLNALGVKGREVGKILNKLLLSVINGDINNKKEELLSFINKIKKG